MSTGGEVANALVCKTSIHGFKSHPVLHKVLALHPHYNSILSVPSSEHPLRLGCEVASHALSVLVPMHSLPPSSIIEGWRGQKAMIEAWVMFDHAARIGSKHNPPTSKQEK